MVPDLSTVKQPFLNDCNAEPLANVEDNSLEESLNIQVTPEEASSCTKLSRVQQNVGTAS